MMGCPRTHRFSPPAISLLVSLPKWSETCLNEHPPTKSVLQLKAVPQCSDRETEGQGHTTELLKWLSPWGAGSTKE